MEPTIYKPSIYNGAGIYKNGAEGGGGGYKFYPYIDEIPGHSSFPRSNISGEPWSFLSGGEKTEILTKAELDVPPSTNKLKISFQKYIPNFSIGAQNLRISLNSTSLLFYAFRNHALWNNKKGKDILLFSNPDVSQYIDTSVVYNGGENYTLNENEYITLGLKSIFDTAVKNQYIIEKNKLTCFEDDVKIFEAQKNNTNTELRDIRLEIESSTNGFYIRNLLIEWE